MLPCAFFYLFELCLNSGFSLLFVPLDRLFHLDRLAISYTICTQSCSLDFQPVSLSPLATIHYPTELVTKGGSLEVNSLPSTSHVLLVAAVLSPNELSSGHDNFSPGQVELDLQAPLQLMSQLAVLSLLRLLLIPLTLGPLATNPCHANSWNTLCMFRMGIAHLTFLGCFIVS